ncbi:hypothetical protein [Desulfosporosinus sp. SB140]
MIICPKCGSLEVCNADICGMKNKAPVKVAGIRIDPAVHGWP